MYPSGPYRQNTVHGTKPASLFTISLFTSAMAFNTTVLESEAKMITACGHYTVIALMCIV